MYQRVAFPDAEYLISDVKIPSILIFNSAGYEIFRMIC
jgi:hypothetical protein